MNRPLPAGPAPDYLRRHYRRTTPVVIVLGCGPQFGFAAAQFLWPAGPDPWAAIRLGFTLLALALPALVPMLVLTVRWERRLKARIVEFAGRLCPHCAYPLPGRSGTTVCPECGTACDMEQTVRAWGGFRPRFDGLWKRCRGAA